MEPENAKASATGTTLTRFSRRDQSSLVRSATSYPMVHIDVMPYGVKRRATCSNTITRLRAMRTAFAQRIVGLDELFSANTVTELVSCLAMHLRFPRIIVAA